MPELGGGKLFPQVFCTPYTAPSSKKPQFTDDVIFSPNKNAPFQLVVILDTLEWLGMALEELRNARELLEEEIQFNEATYIIESLYQKHSKWLEELLAGAEVFRIFFKEEFKPETFKDFPEPSQYDGHLFRKKLKGKYVIVRADRYTFAECLDLNELIMASKALNDIFGGTRKTSVKS